MEKNLYEFIERIVAVFPEAINTWRAQTSDGFAEVSEKLLAAAIDHLESQGKNLKDSKEDNITSSAIGFFNRYGIQASSQTNSRGHVDIHIRHSFRPGFIICGEAKIWDGSSYHCGGLHQVLGYCTGRMPRCFILEYVTKGKIENHFARLQKTLDDELPEQQAGPSGKHATLRWALITEHTHHSSGIRIRVLHAGANLCV